jgi:hypothetical protein
MTLFDQLTTEFANWIDAAPQAALAPLGGDALELRMFADLTRPQAAWLDDFIARWDAMDEEARTTEL